MVKTLIEAFPKEKRVAADDGSSILDISECFMDTIQGENIVGVPSTFLRCQYCTLNCQWCDTKEVWREGNPYSVDEIIKLFEDNGTIKRFKQGQHLVLTGGSPLRQQDALIELINKIQEKHKIKPFVQIENECTIMPKSKMIEIVNVWNNSPKLKNSGNPDEKRYKPDILNFMNSVPFSFFKFVIEKKEDWKNIEEEFLNNNLISKHKVILMPEGETREQLQKHYEACVELCCENGVNMTDRLHVTIWDKKTGV
jgi:7-carboxy-7-deazaguanine synthase